MTYIEDNRRLMMSDHSRIRNNNMCICIVICERTSVSIFVSNLSKNENMIIFIISDCSNMRNEDKIRIKYYVYVVFSMGKDRLQYYQ